MSRQPQAWTIATDRGPVAAGDVLVATNGYTDRAAPWLRRRLVPIGSHIIATEPLTADHADSLIPKRRMVFDSKHFLHYFRLTRDNRLLRRPRGVLRPTPETTRRCAEILQRDMVSVFPSLVSARVDYAWAAMSLYPRSTAAHWSDQPRALRRRCCGYGVAMATYLGALIARRIAGERFDIR